MKNTYRYPLVLMTYLLLQACGGSGSNSANSELLPQGKAFDIVINESELAIGKSIELILFSPNTRVEAINWQQTSGTPLSFVGASHKLISVTPNMAGSYSFSVDFTSNGQPQSLTTSFDVSETRAKFTVPNGQAVISGNKVSLRAYAYDKPIDSINWQQSSELALNIDDDNANLLLFTAPRVTKQDVIARFDVSAEIDGNTYHDSVSVLIEAAPAISNNAYFDEPVAKVFPYNPNSPFADVIVDCVYSNVLTSSCLLSDLPLIAQTTSTPNVDDIMARVVVSHQWMGDNFKAFLTELDPHDDFKKLLRATTAIVIAYDIRPSFYWAATGAIYLDANNFWLTPTERDSINEAPDYRSAFGSELQFEMPWRYVKNNEYAFTNVDINSRASRALSALTYPLGFLLYHELAHANDFFPAQYWHTLDSNLRVLDAAFIQEPVSDRLNVSYPLASQILKDLAQVRYAGETATALEKSYQPTDISFLFAPDGAAHFYSYRTEREDYAMLFEELMMQHRYNIYRDVAVTNNPNHDADSTKEYIVNWGQRGRLGEPHISKRMTFITNNVLPEFDAEFAISQLPQPINLQPGLSWQDNLVTANGLKQRKRNLTKSVKQPQQSYHYFSKPLPKH